MEDIVNLLETYRGRDKVIRLCCYGAMLLAGKDGKNSRLLRVSAALSDCRVVLRLFDDIPMLAYSLQYANSAAKVSQDFFSNKNKNHFLKKLN